MFRGPQLPGERSLSARVGPRASVGLTCSRVAGRKGSAFPWQSTVRSADGWGGGEVDAVGRGNVVPWMRATVQQGAVVDP